MDHTRQHRLASLPKSAPPKKRRPGVSTATSTAIRVQYEAVIAALPPFVPSAVPGTFASVVNEGAVHVEIPKGLNRDPTAPAIVRLTQSLTQTVVQRVCWTVDVNDPGEKRIIRVFHSDEWTAANMSAITATLQQLARAQPRPSSQELVAHAEAIQALRPHQTVVGERGKRTHEQLPRTAFEGLLYSMAYYNICNVGRPEGGGYLEEAHRLLSHLHLEKEGNNIWLQDHYTGRLLVGADNSVQHAGQNILAEVGWVKKNIYSQLKYAQQPTLDAVFGIGFQIERRQGELSKVAFIHALVNVVATTEASNQLKFIQPPAIFLLLLFCCRVGSLYPKWQGEVYQEDSELTHPAFLILSRIQRVMAAAFLCWWVPTRRESRYTMRIRSLRMSLEAVHHVMTALELPCAFPLPAIDDMISGSTADVAEQEEVDEADFAAATEVWSVREPVDHRTKGAKASAEDIAQLQMATRQVQAEVQEYGVEFVETADKVLALTFEAEEGAAAIAWFFKLAQHRDYFKHVLPKPTAVDLFRQTFYSLAMRILGGRKKHGPWEGARLFAATSYHFAVLPLTLPYQPDGPLSPSVSRHVHSSSITSHPTAHQIGFAVGDARDFAHFDTRQQSTFALDANSLNRGFMKADPTEQEVMIWCWKRDSSELILVSHPLLRPIALEHAFERKLEGLIAWLKQRYAARGDLNKGVRSPSQGNTASKKKGKQREVAEEVGELEL